MLFTVSLEETGNKQLTSNWKEFHRVFSIVEKKQRAERVMDVIFYQLVIDSLSGKVMFEQSFEKGEGMNHRDIWWMNIVGRRNSKYKDPEVEQAIPVGWIEMRKGEKGRRQVKKI